MPSYSDARRCSGSPPSTAGKIRCNLLLHTGEETLWLAKRVLAAPWWRVIYCVRLERVPARSHGTVVSRA
jgi:hypothetical protein